MRRILILAAIGLLVLSSTALAVKVDPKLYGSPEGQVCIKCHELKTPGLFKLWRSGKMGQAGVNCYDCHKAEKATDKAPGNPGGYDHRGFWITVIVSPKDCARCHKEQFDQQQVSHHAKAADILNSSDNYLGTVVGGPAAVNERPAGEQYDVEAHTGGRSGCGPNRTRSVSDAPGHTAGAGTWPTR